MKVVLERPQHVPVLADLAQVQVHGDDEAVDERIGPRTRVVELRGRDGDEGVVTFARCVDDFDAVLAYGLVAGCGGARASRRTGAAASARRPPSRGRCRASPCARQWSVRRLLAIW